jgi:IS5 family transposase
LVRSDFSLVEPHYSKGEIGHKPVGLDIMLRVYFLHQWFTLSDPAVEDALYESPALRRFAGIELGRARYPTRRRSSTSTTCWKNTIWEA